MFVFGEYIVAKWWKQHFWAKVHSQAGNCLYYCAKVCISRFSFKKRKRFIVADTSRVFLQKLALAFGKAEKNAGLTDKRMLYRLL